MLKSWVVKSVNQQQKRAQNYQEEKQYQKQRTGDVFITKNQSSKDVKSDKIGGEYVDFEEVK